MVDSQTFLLLAQKSQAPNSTYVVFPKGAITEEMTYKQFVEARHVANILWQVARDRIVGQYGRDADKVLLIFQTNGVVSTSPYSCQMFSIEYISEGEHFKITTGSNWKEAKLEKKDSQGYFDCPAIQFPDYVLLFHAFMVNVLNQTGLTVFPGELKF